MNEENKYNQNFNGVYCTCARPYPDPEDTTGDEMLQCVICEDWYHSKHLNCNDDIPDDNSYEELICSDCMKKHEFLWLYAPQYSANKTINKDLTKKSDEKIDVTAQQSVICTKPVTILGSPKSSCFWLEGWRSALCTCNDCKKIYEAEEVMFLLDPTDSVQAYEEAGKLQRPESQYEKGMKALASLDHVQQVNAIEEYNIMKERLKEYLQKFAQNKKVVREEDIKEFFSEISSNKKPKVVVPTFCR